MSFLFIEDFVNAETFKDNCIANGLSPEKVVFIFPGNSGHHTPGTTLFTSKGGAGLANASMMIGQQGYPTLSLPTTSMEKWVSDVNQQKIVEGAIKDLWRAVGAGYSLMLPVRARKRGYFEKGFAHNGLLEPNFWGGIQTTSNAPLAQHYMVHLDKLIAFMRLSDDEKILFISKNPEDSMCKAYTEGQGMSKDHPWLQSPQSRQVVHPKPTIPRTQGHVSASSSEAIHWKAPVPTETVKKEIPKPNKILFKIPPSYDVLYDTGDPMMGARALLNDYTKGNSAFVRFFTGHWNRHHIVEVNQIVEDIDANKIKNIEQLRGRLSKIQLVNPAGSLATRIHFLEEQFAKNESSKSSVPMIH